MPLKDIRKALTCRQACLLTVCLLLPFCTQAQPGHSRDTALTARPADTMAMATADSIPPADTACTTATAGSLPPVAEGYGWISYRGKADIIDTGGTRSCNLFVVNRIDSIIYINISVSGMEILRMAFTPDTITYVNKLGYNYYKGGYAPLRHLSDGQLDFNILQAIVNGETDTLRHIRKFAFEYDSYQAVDSTQSFFRHFVWKDLNHVISIEGSIKKVRIGAPGPTAVRIPEKFTEIKPF